MRHFTYFPKEAFTYDLHVLSIPPTFVLSQDQTLQFIYCISFDSVCYSWFDFYPQTILTSVLLFSFQRPGTASPSPLRQESKNIETEMLCQSQIDFLFDFFSPTCRPHFAVTDQASVWLYRLSVRLSRTFFAFFAAGVFVGNEGGI